MTREFIKQNDITFQEGNRNTSIIILIGYALYLNLSRQDLKDQLEEEIKKDTFIDKEIDAKWEYCKKRKYGKYWEEEDTKLKYKY